MIHNLWKDLRFTILGNGFAGFLGAIGAIASARYLGPAGRGEFASAIVWANILMVVAQIGLVQAISYYTARDTEHVGNIFFTMLQLWLIQSVTIIGIGTLLVHYFILSYQPEAFWSVQIFLLSIPLALLSSYLIPLLQGLKRFDLYGAFGVLGSSRQILSIIIAFLFGVTKVMNVVVILLIVQATITSIALLTFLLYIKPQGEFQKSLAIKLLQYGMKSYLGNISWMANAKLDQFIMSIYVSLDVLGRYSVAVSYSMILFPIAASVANVIYPRVSSQDQESGKKSILLGVMINVVTLTLFSFALAIFSPILIPVMFGEEFSSVLPTAIVLLVGVVFLGVTYVLSDGLRGLNHPIIPSVAELIGLMLTMIGLAIFLPRYEEFGAAMVSTIVYVIIMVILIVVLRRITNRSPLSEVNRG